MAKLLKELTINLFVEDLEAELDFYELFDIDVSYFDKKDKNKAEVNLRDYTFLITEKQDVDIENLQNLLAIEVETTDIEKILNICKKNDLNVLSKIQKNSADDLILNVGSPNGYRIKFIES